MGQPTGDFRQDGLRARTGEVFPGDLMLTVGGADGSEATACPDGWRPEPRRRGPRERTGPTPGPGLAVGPLALGTGPADLPLLDREADIAELLGQLAEGRSVRLVGQAGSGRSALLAAVADAAGGLAPDGVVRLGGHRRSADDLLQDLFAATHHAPGVRPDRRELAARLSEVGAVVVIDDVDLEESELDRLLGAAPDCAFLVSVPPDGRPLQLGSRLRDHLVAGLSRGACLNLVSRLAGRQLDESERSWAVDLWFESEGLPLRFVQAAALLRQRDVAVDALVAAQEDRRSVFGTVQDVDEPDDPAVLEGELRRSVPLPTVAESAAPALRLAEGLGDSAREVLRLALALGGECPTAAHLPALIDVAHGEGALQELVDAGLAVSIGGHHRLAAGVLESLSAHWETGEIGFGAAEHFSWWVGHGSVGTEQIAAEAEVILGAMLADRTAARPEAVLRLARAAAPALALSLRWGAWERSLQLGLEAARTLGASGEEAWFHQELGALALCRGTSQRASAELDAAVALRAALGEPRGGVAARRMVELLRATLDTPAEDDENELAPVGRRPVIRAIAQAPFRFRTAPRTGRDTRRTVLAATAAVLAVGVLGTAIGLSLAGQDPQGGGNRTRPGTSVDDDPLPSGLDFGSSGSPTPSPVPEATGSASESPAETPSAAPTPSASRTSRKPTPGKSGTTTPPPASPTQDGAPTPPTTPPSSSVPPTSTSPSPDPSGTPTP
ncbi:ATP-binding protein [Kitasatospora sp. NPDC088346]|uniref:ATP-binding protein n=1 Tax=Kitasatospora sp. NPDC088346 TaxID=3364073 RepID=UPI00380AB05F